MTQDRPTAMDRMVSALRIGAAALIPTLGILWLMDVQIHLDLPISGPSYFVTILGLAIAAALLMNPYGSRAGILEVILALAGLGAWVWCGINYDVWIVEAAERGPDKWIPGVVGMVLMLEALRKTCGMTITGLVWVLIIYGLAGHNLPGLLEAAYTAWDRFVLYLYADSQAVPGLVLDVITTVVLGFILFGEVLERTGAGTFYTNTALGIFGGTRGGPAKVAVAASSMFGMISGSTVANVVSTGVVTIPLMKKTGFPAPMAGGIEAVASNGGQLAPPLMGATAFLIADFLDMSYAEVALAAAIPAAIYYLVLFAQVDLYAARNGLAGLPRSELPRLGPTLRAGWPFILPVALLVYLMFGLGYNPGKTALYVTAATLLIGAIVKRVIPGPLELARIMLGAGTQLVPILLIGGGAGVVIGTLNLTGLAFSISNALANLGADSGVLIMLLVTALIAMVLGMGMPTAAVYLVLSVILAPALEKLGIEKLAAHMFIFYFGLISMITPPVAVASYAAGGIAKANLWATGLAGMRLGASGYLLPFLMAFNPALVLIGTWEQIVIVIASAIASGYMLADALAGHPDRPHWQSLLLGAAALVIGAVSVWLPEDSAWALLAPAAAIAYYLLRRSFRNGRALASS